MKYKRIAIGATLAYAMALQASSWAVGGPADPNAPVAPAVSWSDVFSGYHKFVADSGEVANPQSGAAPAGHQMPGMDEMKGMDSDRASSSKSKQGDMKDMPGMENTSGMNHGRMQHMQH